MHIEQVTIDADSNEMEGALWLPEDHIGVILFANSSGSNRVKPPNDYVASVLRGVRLGTLWLDLLTAQEKRKRDAVSDIDLLTKRLHAACGWLRHYHATSALPIGLFGASNCAAAAMQLASEQGHDIAAVVCRGGRPDLAGKGALERISAPTLLIVGGLDDGVVALNRTAFAALRCKKRLEIIPGATHSFEEPGSPEVVARLARGWFLRYATTVERNSHL